MVEEPSMFTEEVKDSVAAGSTVDLVDLVDVKY
jgi:hypothetical protein